jgi:hypothetical protein
MGRKKTTVYLDEDLLRAAKVMAARTGARDYEVLEAALKSFLGYGILERARGKGKLSEERALSLAYRELHAHRAGK